MTHKADEFVVRVNEDAQFHIIHTVCGDIIAEIEHGDTLDVLLLVCLANHECIDQPEPEPEGTVIHGKFPLTDPEPITCWLHTFDDSVCDNPGDRTGESICGHGKMINEVYV